MNKRVYKGVRPDLIAIGSGASELCQFDLSAPVGTVPHKGDVASTPLLIDVALVVRLSVLQSTATKISVKVSCHDWTQLSVCCDKQR